MTQVTLKGRLLTNIDKKKENINSKGETTIKYVAQVVLDDDQVHLLDSAISKTLSEKFEGSIPSKLVNHVKHVGDEEEYSYTLNRTFVRPSSRSEIRCYTRINGNLEPTLNEEKKMYFYTGANVAVSIDIYAKSKQEAAKSGGSPFVACGVRGLLFISHNDPIGDNAVTGDEFKDYSSDVTNDFSI